MKFGGWRRETVEPRDLVGSLPGADVEHHSHFFDAYEVVHENKLPE